MQAQFTIKTHPAVPCLDWPVIHTLRFRNPNDLSLLMRLKAKQQAQILANELQQEVRWQLTGDSDWQSTLPNATEHAHHLHEFQAKRG